MDDEMSIASDDSSYVITNEADNDIRSVASTNKSEFSWVDVVAREGSVVSPSSVQQVRDASLSPSTTLPSILPAKAVCAACSGMLPCLCTSLVLNESDDDDDAMRTATAETPEPGDNVDNNKHLREEYLGKQAGLHGRTARKRDATVNGARLSNVNALEGGSAGRHRAYHWRAHRRDWETNTYELSAFDLEHPHLSRRTTLNKAKAWELVPRILAEQSQGNVSVLPKGGRSAFTPQGFHRVCFAVPVVGHLETAPAYETAKPASTAKAWRNWKPNTYYKLIKHVPRYQNHGGLLPHAASELEASMTNPSALVRAVTPVPLPAPVQARRDALQCVSEYTLQTAVRGTKFFEKEPGTHMDAKVLACEAVARELAYVCSARTWSQHAGTQAHYYCWALRDAYVCSARTWSQHAGTLAHYYGWALRESPQASHSVAHAALDRFDDWALTLEFKRPTAVAAISLMGRAPKVVPFPMPDDERGSRRQRDEPVWPVIADVDTEQYVKRLEISVLEEAPSRKWVSLGVFAANSDCISEAFIDLQFAGGPFVCRRMRLRPLSAQQDGYKGAGPAMRVGVWEDASALTDEGRHVDGRARRTAHGALAPDHVAYSIMVPDNESAVRSSKLVTGRDSKYVSASNYDMWNSNRSSSRKAKTDLMRNIIREAME